jgi:hypothetical protein
VYTKNPFQERGFSFRSFCPESQNYVLAKEKVLNSKWIGHFLFSVLRRVSDFERDMVTIWLLEYRMLKSVIQRGDDLVTRQASISDEGNSYTLLMEFLFFK